MMNTTFFKKLTIVLVAIFFASCDKDYNTLGADIVGNEHFDFAPHTYDVKLYNQKVPVVQTSNLPLNQLGIYINPVFGKTKANFVTQLSLEKTKPTFKSNVVIDSVVLTVPYFSRKKTNTSTLGYEYVLDSIYNSYPNSNDIQPINLKVLHNGFYLRDYDPDTNFETAQRYYSNQDADFSANVVSSFALNNGPVAENTVFKPDTKEYIKFKVDANNVMMPKITENIESRNSPRMRLHLDNNYFRDNIILAPASKLDNNNVFRDYFRGLYFQVQDASAGTMMSLDFSKGNVTIYYKQDKVDNDPSVKEMKSLVLNMTGNTVNLLDNSNETPAYTGAFGLPNQNGGVAQNLFLKGGEGSQAFIELFSEPGKLDELQDMAMKDNILINEASLTFTIDPRMNGNREPNRILVYNTDNNRPVIDYFIDNTTFPSNTKFNKYNYDGIIQRDATKNGIKYKVRITNHVNNIIKKDSANVRLGVVVTENINVAYNAFLKTPVIVPSPTDPTKKWGRLPAASIMNPLGTILYGNSFPLGSPNYEKNVKFEIYYTKPN